VSKEGEMIDLGVKLGLIEKTGAWYSYSGQKLGQGKENVRQLLKENKTLSAEIEQLVRDQLMPETINSESDVEA
jgi:recombination protein RecA